MDAETKKQQRRDTYQFRVNTLLTLIGLWLALPTTCGVLQRMTDTLTSLDIINQYANTVIIVKFIIDSGLLCFYSLGIGLLIFIGVTGWIAHKASEGIHDSVDKAKQTATKTAETIGSAVTEGADKVKTTYVENVPKIGTAINKKIPEIQDTFNTVYGNSKIKAVSTYAKFKEKFPRLGRFLDSFKGPDMPE